MSVIACKVTNDKILIAADTQVTKGDCKMFGLNYHKLLKVGEIVIGMSGNCDEANLLCGFIKNNSIPCDNANDIAMFMSEFYKWRDNINDTLKPTTEDKCTSNCSYIIIIRGRAFIIGGLVVFELSDGAIFATGSGESYAIGAMEFGATVQEAVAIACKRDVTCSEPIDYFEIDRIKEG